MNNSTSGGHSDRLRDGRVESAVIAAAVVFFNLAGCTRQTALPAEPVFPPAAEIQETGEQLLIDAMDEMTAIADWSRGAGTQIPGGAGFPVLRKEEGDSVFVYGTVTPGGLGVVVTERHTHPKGLLLITVRKSYGTPGRLVSEVKQFDSYDGFRADQPSLTTTTEVRPGSRDTIVTYVLRNGVTETYNFRLPVVTRVSNQTAGTVRITSRYALAGGVVTEVTDENQALIRRTTSTALPSGALETRTDNPDGSWRIVTSLGRADGSVFRETISGH